MTSEPLTGSLLRTLAASKPAGNFLELGTGTGVSTAWLLSGMDLGPLRVKLTGPAQPLGKKNLLAFDFTHIRIMLLGRRVYSSEFGGRKAIATDCSGQGIAKLPFFVFFCVGESFIAARGRGGGLALWVKER